MTCYWKHLKWKLLHHSYIWWFENLIFKCTFLISSCYMLSNTSIRLFLAEWCRIYLPEQFFWRPRLSSFQDKGSLDQNRTKSFIWHQSTLSAETRAFIKTQSTSKSYNLNLQRLWPGKQPQVGKNNWPFSTPPKRLLDTALSPTTLLHGGNLEMFMLKSCLPN